MIDVDTVRCHDADEKNKQKYNKKHKYLMKIANLFQTIKILT